MKTIIAGSRGVTDFELVAWSIMNAPFEVTEGVCGEARGVDTLGKNWCLWQDIPVKSFIPDWEGQGKKAGFIRNKQMADYADALIAIWDGESKGTKHMIDTMEALGKPVYIYNTDKI